MTAMQTSLPVHAARSSPPLLSLVAVTAGVLAAFVALFATVGIAPKFYEIAKDFGMDLSMLSMQLFGLTRWLCGTGAGAVVPAWPFVAIGFALAAAGLYRMCFLPRHRVSAGWIGLIILLISLIYMLLAVVGLWEQLITMIRSLQGGA
ncbi:MAG TPA: hypothetical protein VK157_14675 [Phycisphaerales bacterium]|nr:hypothetical protein [Phycisphaerales bacterium]